MHWFEGYGVELEYTIVDRNTLSVRPIADELLRTPEGRIESEIEKNSLCWSNELVQHVIELKGNGPVPRLAGLASRFQGDVRTMNALLEVHNAILMPTAMHPWMDPARETKLWEHEYSVVYEAFHRIFNCTGHGWSNLQSVHLNLPFEGDEEFGRLHAAIRLVIPLLPALAASSPIVERHSTGLADTRMHYYRNNAHRIASVTGDVIPEPVYSIQEYKENILQKIYADIAPLDPDGTLQHEWLNARGAIARFERNTFEIRVLDVQECPQSDCAVIWAVVETLKRLVHEQWSSYQQHQAWETATLKAILLETIEKGDQAEISDTNYMKMFGLNTNRKYTAKALWEHLCGRFQNDRTPELDELGPIVEHILTHGSLSSRILQRLGPDYSDNDLTMLYRDLCHCLHEGRLFIP